MYGPFGYMSNYSSELPTMRQFQLSRLLAHLAPHDQLDTFKNRISMQDQKLLGSCIRNKAHHADQCTTNQLGGIKPIVLKGR